MRYMYWFQFMAISSFGKRHCFSKPWDAFWAPCFQTNPSNPLPLLLMSIFLATSHLLIYTWTKVYPLKLFQTGDWFSQSRPTLLTQHSIGTHMVGILVNYCHFCQNKIKSPPVHTKIAGISPNVRIKGLGAAWRTLLTHHHMVKLHPKRGFFVSILPRVWSFRAKGHLQHLCHSIVCGATEVQRVTPHRSPTAANSWHGRKLWKRICETMRWSDPKYG